MATERWDLILQSCKTDANNKSYISLLYFFFLITEIGFNERNNNAIGIQFWVSNLLNYLTREP